MKNERSDCLSITRVFAHIKSEEMKVRREFVWRCVLCYREMRFESLLAIA